MAFDGSNDYIDCGTDSSLDITNAITMSAWVKPADLTSYNGIVVQGGQKQVFRINSDGKVYFAIYDSTNTIANIFSSAPLSTVEQWYFLSASFDGTIMRLYINGVENNTLTPASGDMTIS